MNDEILTLIEVVVLPKVANKIAFTMMAPPQRELQVFKRGERTENGALVRLTPDDENATSHLARFIEVLHLDDSEVTA